MYNSILQIFIMLSIGTVIYIFARAVPRIADEDLANNHQTSSLDRVFSKLPLKQLDMFFNNLLEKLLRRVKLILMKLDNITGRYLDKIKKLNIHSKDKVIKQTLFDNLKPADEDNDEEKIEENRNKFNNAIK